MSDRRTVFSQSRGKLRFDEGLAAYVPGASVQRERSAGACRGTYDLADCLAEGYAAGESAARGDASGRRFFVTGAAEPNGGFIGALPHNRSPDFAKAFVDFQNDVTAKDLKLATREGFRSIEHVKRYTTTGMATDQGKTSNMNALAIVAADLGKSIPEVGLTTFRNPYTPVTFGALAGASRGDLFDPVRKTPIHDWAAENGAVFEDVGLWKRARYFPRGGEDMDAAVARECLAVRQSVGIFDATDARQDRGRRPGRGRVPEPHLHQRLDEARARPLPLRADADRGRLRHGRRRRRPTRRRTASTSPRRPAARRASSITWRTTCRPSSPTSRSG